MVPVTDFQLPPKARTISLRRTSAAAFDAAAVGRLDDASGQHKAIWPWWRSNASRTRSKHRGSNPHSGATDDPADARAAPHYFTLIVILLPLRVIGIDGLVLLVTASNALPLSRLM